MFPEEPIITVPCGECGTQVTELVSFIEVSEKGYEEIGNSLGVECGCYDRYDGTDIIASRAMPEPHVSNPQFDMMEAKV